VERARRSSRAGARELPASLVHAPVSEVPQNDGTALSAQCDHLGVPPLTGGPVVALPVCRDAPPCVRAVEAEALAPALAAGPVHWQYSLGVAGQDRG
jgi:hypothetical protein